MCNFVSSSFARGGLTALLLATDSNTSPNILRVCTSPACKDDGAISTFNRLSALAPPCVRVVRGGCTSLCGSGPVVEICDSIDATQSVKRRRIKDDALIGLLDEFFETETEQVFAPRLRDRLLDGYSSYIKANEAYEARQYQLAVELYEEALQNGRKPAMALQEAREKYSIVGEMAADGNYPMSLDWIVQTFRNSCRSRLELSDVDGARRDAFAATVFSKNNDAASHECLADVCSQTGDAIGEYQAVKAAIEQYDKVEERYSVPEMDAVTRAEAAKIRANAETRKRELGFRLAKLDRQLKKS